jgi:hypothetical protein
MRKQKKLGMGLRGRLPQLVGRGSSTATGLATGHWRMWYLLSWVSQRLYRACMCSAAVAHGVVICLGPPSCNKRCAPRFATPSLSLYTMSTSLHFLQDLRQVLQAVRHFVTGNVRRTLVEAGVQILQFLRESASRGLELCVPIFFFSFLLC